MDRLLLSAHSANFVTFAFVFVSDEIFSARLYTPLHLLRPGAIAPSAPVSYATGRSRGNLRDLSRAVGVDVARGISSYHIISEIYSAPITKRT